MATLENVAKNAACNGTVDLIDGGAGNPNGQLIFRTAGDVEVATLNYSATAYGAAALGIAVAGTIVSDTSATGGVTTKWTAEDKANAKIFTGTVTSIGGGGEIELTEGTNISPGPTVGITSLSHVQP